MLELAIVLSVAALCFGERLRPLFEARVTILLALSLCAFLGWLAYLWYTLPSA